jgi:pimeloyl-ACP methyl ester carboxylesterase
MRSPLLLLTLLLTTAAVLGQSAISSDPPADPAAPPSMREFTIQSHGQPLVGVFYLAAGTRPHPTAILLHGFPGYEQNLDLAQTLRRAGWNVLALHYRGSWGTPGVFSFAHAMEDADAELAFILDPANSAKSHIDTARVVLIGHSMGGFLAASAAAHRAAVPGPQPAAVIMISAWNIAGALATAKPATREATGKAFLADTEPNDFLPLAGCTPQSLADEIFDHRTSMTFAALAPGLAHSRILLITADDGSDPDSDALLRTLQSAGNTQVSKQHFATDHPFSGQRIALESTILNWLAPLTGR